MQQDHAQEDDGSRVQQQQRILAPMDLNTPSHTSGVSSFNRPPVLLGRPMSLGNLLIQRDHLGQEQHSSGKTASIVSKRSFDVLSPNRATSSSGDIHLTQQQQQQAQGHSSSYYSFTRSGQQPTPSTFTNSTTTSASRHNQHHMAMSNVNGAHSPSSSVYSFASSTPSTASFPIATRTVLLPQNNQGIRTRVNILPASAAAANRNSNHNLLTKERRASSSSLLSLQPENTAGGAGRRSASGTGTSVLVDPPPRLQSVSSAATLAYNYSKAMQQDNTTTTIRSSSPSLSSSNAPQSASSNTAPFAAGARRAVSDSTSATPPSTTRPDSPGAYSTHSSHSTKVNASTTADYRFPAPRSDSLDSNHTYAYGSSGASTSMGGRHPARSASSPLAGPGSEFGSLTAQPASSVGGQVASTSANGFGTSPQQQQQSNAAGNHPAYHRSNTTDGVYNHQPSNTPWEPPTSSSSSSAALSRPPQAPFTSHSSKPSRNHLANLPKSLIPGGYDFSPSSTSTHDSAHTQTYSSPHQPQPYQPQHMSSRSASTASAFAYARDRSASVPRTVSSYGGDGSSRSSFDQTAAQQQQQFRDAPAVPEIDASFQTARQTMENGNMSHEKSRRVGDDSGHARGASAFSSASHGDSSSRQSTEEDGGDGGGLDYSLAPLISPIPPKLDLDFGNSSGFSLDFGGDFGGSLGLGGSGGGSGSGSGSLGLSFGDFGRKQSLPRSTATQKAEPAKDALQMREKNDSTATTTMASFLSLQDSTMSTADVSDISFLDVDRAAGIPPLSAASEMTIGPGPAQQQAQYRQSDVAQEERSKSEDDEDDKPLGALLQTGFDKKSPSRLTPTDSSSSGHSFSNLSAGQRSQNGTASTAVAEVVASAQASSKAYSRPDTALRSESPASFISSSSLSRPESSLFTGQGNLSAEGTTRKRLLENPAYVGEYNSSDDSRRTTLSSGEQVPLKTSSSSSSANLPSQGLQSQHNQNVRLSSNKSLPPVPPGDRGQARPGTSSSQASSIERAALPASVSSRDQLGLGLAPNREQLGAGRRSYSEHSQTYDSRPESSNSRTRQPESFVGSRDDFPTPQFGKIYDDVRATSRASGSDTLSLHSNANSGYTSTEVTRNFSAPVAPEATRVYRASTESEAIARQRRSEQARTRATTLDTESIKNPFDSNRSSKQDIPLATLVRPKPTTRTFWPNGELRKRDATTDKLLETVTAKLEVWIMRHPERVMTPQEAERHNRTPSPRPTAALSQQFQPSPKPAIRIPPPVVLPAEAAPPAPPSNTSLDSDRTFASSEMKWEVKNASAATTSVAKTVIMKPKPIQPPPDLSKLRANAKSSSTARSPEPVTAQQSVKTPDAQATSTLSTASITPSLPALTLSSSLLASTPSDSLASTSRGSELTRTPLTAVPSSPSLDPSIATTTPLKILPKGRSTPNPSKVRKPLSPGGEQPWGQAWLDITESLLGYKSAFKQQKPERASFIQTGFLPNFRTEEHSALLRNRTLSTKQKDVLLDWVDILFEDLQGTPPNRGACLDGISVVVESRLMSYFAFPSRSESFKRYERTIAMLTAFAVEKLNGKAIFANTLGFAGKMLAAAFWNLDGVGLKLLRLLPAVKKQHIARIYADTRNAECPGTFPAHLRTLAFEGSPVEYTKLFKPVRPGTSGDTHLYKATFDVPATDKSPASSDTDNKDRTNSKSREVNIEMAGNWLIRWTATDSDLPFAFMRAYHRQLSNYLPLYQPDLAEPVSTAQLIRAPGYAFISATLLEVCDALIHRNLRSVTTMATSNNGVNANESANLAAGQKPKSLEIVSKRVIQTIFEVVGGALQSGTPESSPTSYTSAALRHNFGNSLSMWIRAVTRKTSMWDTRGIFALLDLIEGLMYNVCCPPYEEGVEEDDEVWIPSEVGLKLFDTKFILSFIRTILSKADNTTCLLRTISFLYTEFQSFTLRTEDREELCDRVILDSEVFERLFLYYNVGVRGYFLRLLVYRLARLGSADDGKPASKDPSIFSTLRLFEYRLEKIRKRHDEIDPLDDWDSDSSDDFRPRPKRSTVCSTWGVRDKPWAMDLARIGDRSSSDSSEDEGGQGALERVKSSLQDIQEDGMEESTLRMEPGEVQNHGSLSARKNPSQKSSTSSAWLMPPVPTHHSTMSNQNTNPKKGVAKSARKVWNALTNRKNQTGGVSNSKGRHNASEAVVPFYDDAPLDQSGLVAVSLPLDKSDARGRRSSTSSSGRSALPNGKPSSGRPSMEDKTPFPAEIAVTAQAVKPKGNGDQVLSINVPPRNDASGLEPPTPRLRKRSSRKSIRRGASQSATVNGRLSAMSPRSRRSSMYSFDLDTETPRSDSFDLPRSPLLSSANGIVQSGSASPAIGSNAGVLSLSPVAFGALMDGALSFGMDSDDINGDKSGDRLTPGGHKRLKSVSSARNRSRPVSVASDRTGPSPRVSKRFSKRASILPPQALDLLKESPSEPVPKIPEQYKSPTTGEQANLASSTINSAALRAPSPDPYERKLHPYAIRGLREYEDCLDEWELFVHRVKEEEGMEGRELAALIPRLQCAWPSTWEE